MSTFPVYSQQKKSDKYQLALTYEQQGDFRNAARLFQELYSDHPEQLVYFQGVARSLTALQRYQELMPLIEIELVDDDGPSINGGDAVFAAVAAAAWRAAGFLSTWPCQR